MHFGSTAGRYGLTIQKRGKRQDVQSTTSEYLFYVVVLAAHAMSAETIPFRSTLCGICNF